MARMIPPVISPDVKSPGEHEVFQRLKDDADTRDWIVLHSLDVAAHRRQISGEIDFVVIVPGRGVLCLEVKAHSRIRCEGGLWYLGSSPPEPRGPFKQAAEGLHSIRDRLASRRPALSRIVFWSAVVFPYVDFTAVSEEWHHWQVIDRRAFQSRPIAHLLLAVLDSARSYLRTVRTAAWFDPAAPEPTTQQCLAIAEALRPDFEFYESPKTRAGRLHEELKRFTAEQTVALDAMEANPRVIFAGPAGTGKTLLAIEAARRAHAAGRRTLLVCFNRLLGRWLEEQTADLVPPVATATLHGYMRGVWGEAVPTSPDQQFWETDLPFRASIRLLEGAGGGRFDEIIVDEAQDILRDGYLDFLDLSLRGGLAAGRWRMFGDFEKQAIFGAADVPLERFQQIRSGHAPVYSLRVNCRSTPRIAAFVHLLGGLDPAYSRILRPDNGVEPAVLKYRDAGHQSALLVQSLQNLQEEGLTGRDIVVLSRNAVASCAATLDAPPWNDRLRPFEAAGAGYIRYGTVQSFKGLEAPAIIVTDIDCVDDTASTALFYVAITRSVYRLIILVDERLAPALARTLLSA